MTAPLLFALLALAPAQSDDATPPVPGTEQADEARQRAGAIVNEGNILFERSQYLAALAKYESAYRVFASAKILFNIAEAHYQLGHADEATTFYERFLVEAKIDPTSQLAGKVKERLETMKRELAYLSFEGGAGAELALDGRTIGSLPMKPIHVSPGEHRVGASIAGAKPFETKVVAEKGETKTVEIVLQLPKVAERREPEEGGDTKERAVTQPATTAQTSPGAEDNGVTSKWWFWTAIGGAAVVVGTVAIVAATSGGSDFVPSGELGTTSTSQWTHN